MFKLIWRSKIAHIGFYYQSNIFNNTKTILYFKMQPPWICHRTRYSQRISIVLECGDSNRAERFKARCLGRVNNSSVLAIHQSGLQSFHCMNGKLRQFASISVFTIDWSETKKHWNSSSKSREWSEWNKNTLAFSTRVSLLPGCTGEKWCYGSPSSQNMKISIDALVSCRSSPSLLRVVYSGYHSST